MTADASPAASVVGEAAATGAAAGRVADPDRLPLRLCLGWGVGTLGVSVMLNSINVLLSRFVTDYLGIAVGVFGMIYFISKMYDAATDPLMGLVSDRTRTRFGRRRPYLLLGGLVCAIAYVGLFNAPSVEETPAAVLVLALLLLLYSTGYTIFNVPYLAMPAEMTTSYHERTRLISFRVYAIGLGTLLGTSAAPALIAAFGGGREGHMVLAWVFGGVVLGVSVLTFLGTRGARATQRVTTSTLSRAEQWRLLLSNKPFLILMGVKTLHLGALAVTMGAWVYFIVYVLDRGYGAVALLGLANGLGMLAGAPLWSRLARITRDKRRLYITSSLLAAAVLMTWLLASPSEPMLVTLLRKFLHGITSAGSLLFGQAMLPDAISHDAARSKLRREGIFSGIYTTAEKLSSAFGGAATAAFLGVMGYVSSTSGGAEQPQSAITAIYLSLSVIPAAMLVLSALLLTRYKLDESRVQADARAVDELAAAERQASGAAT